LYAHGISKEVGNKQGNQRSKGTGVNDGNTFDRVLMAWRALFFDKTNDLLV
jgi:hypothetical protein